MVCALVEALSVSWPSHSWGKPSTSLPRSPYDASTLRGRATFMRPVLMFVTDGYDAFPITRFQRWLAQGGCETVFAGAPSVSRVFGNGIAEPLNVRPLSTYPPQSVRGVVVVESATLQHELQRPHVREWFLAAEAEGVPIVLMGGSILATARSGLLRHRKAAGPYESIPDLIREGVEITDDAVVHDGVWITARSPLDLEAAANLAFGLRALDRMVERRPELR